MSAIAIRSEALLLRAVPYGESDLVTTFLCAHGGKIAAMARGARKSTKRFGGALEPFHTSEITLQDRGRDLTTLIEAKIVRVRVGIGARLDAVDAAGIALRWARDLCPPRTEEPGAYRALIELLDALDERDSDARAELALAALRILSEVGYALELDRCVVCGKPCPEDRAATIDPVRGGIVCRSCGGARFPMSANVRQSARAMQRGERLLAPPEESNELVKIAELAMAAHAELGA
jgi:DNA repair protein RecO (recombination protein O)